MDRKIELTWEDVRDRALRVASGIIHSSGSSSIVNCYPVPNGGIHAAQAVQLHMSINLIQDPSKADVVIDDIIDSGETRKEIQSKFNPHIFAALVNKKEEELDGVWVSFPWEDQPRPWLGDEDKTSGPMDAVTRLLQYIGEDPTREGLKDTPKRVIKAYDEIFAGYRQDPKEFLKVFEDGACDEMVLVKDIEFYSNCEHHMQPFFGKAHIAYVPNKKVIGVSKLARILDIYARRLQVQERLTTQVVEALMETLQPKGAACIIEAKHFCMVCRGVRKQNSSMVTSAMQGVFRESKNAARLELLELLK